MAGADANLSFQLAEFMEVMTTELSETGFIEGFEFCHFRARRGMRVDGYCFSEKGAVDLFVADFSNREELESLTRTEADAAFRRVTNFFQASLSNLLYQELEETSPEYGLARDIADRRAHIARVNFFLLSERTLSERLQILDDNEVGGIPASYHIWDLSRLQRQRGSRSHKEALDIDFQEMFGAGLSCLPAHLGSGTYPSYLIVMPGDLLSRLYEKYGARLLEQNVRSFLQARGNVNKGIRNTILQEPNMFFAYNNGITATAQEVMVEESESGLQINCIKDLQIVNGGQTTASLFHTHRKEKATLQSVFVQMKLSVVESEESETVVSRISEYANTQNRVNAADFFSNHPFHRRMEEFSRRIWAPAQQGAQRETKWFYERARGQYLDAQSKLTPAERNRFKAEYPRHQMFTKTDLAKFENVWDEHPRWVNLGAQKNFARYATRIGTQWSKTPDDFNELYYRRVIARALIFRKAEKLVSEQPWYNGGYRANIVAYAIGSIGECCKLRNMVVDHSRIWNRQSLFPSLVAALTTASRFVNEDIVNPPIGISNISEWCKKEACWQRIQSRISELEKRLPEDFWSELSDLDDLKVEVKAARKIQKIDNGIDAQKWVFDMPVEKWSLILEEEQSRGFLTPKEVGILKIAQQIPARIPSEKQSAALIEIVEKARSEGVAVD